ncbi:hypothetical protein WMY93_025583 [Mugilogobius chulae]|uniref:Uncharacterized protein n=1 Tax=Mugilogobius chulae TaxID=88201 RepID=A0AAW0MV32_9GOBI
MEAFSQLKTYISSHRQHVSEVKDEKKQLHEVVAERSLTGETGEQPEASVEEAQAEEQVEKALALVGQLEQQTQHTEEENQHLRSDNERLQTELEKQGTYVAMLETENFDLSELISEYQASNELILEQLRLIDETHDNALDKCEDLERQNYTLRSDVERFQSLYQEQQAENVRLSELLSENKPSQEENTDEQLKLLAETQDKCDKWKDLEKANISLRSNVEILQSLCKKQVAENVWLAEARDKACGECKAFERENVSLRSDVERVESLCKKQQAKNARLTTLLSENNQLTEELDEVTSALSLDAERLELLIKEHQTQNAHSPSAVAKSDMRQLENKLDEKSLQLLEKDELIGKQNHQILSSETSADELNSIVDVQKQQIHKIREQLELTAEEQAGLSLEQELSSALEKETALDEKTKPAKSERTFWSTAAKVACLGVVGVSAFAMGFGLAAQTLTRAGESVCGYFSDHFQPTTNFFPF